MFNLKILFLLSVMVLSLNISCESQNQKNARLTSELSKSNPMSSKAFKATRPKNVQMYRCWAQLDSVFYYEYRGKDNEFWSINLGLGEESWSGVRGYIDKNSQDGKAMFEILKDGNTHPVEIDIAYTSDSQSDGSCRIYKFHHEFWGNPQ